MWQLTSLHFLKPGAGQNKAQFSCTFFWSLPFWFSQLHLVQSCSDRHWRMSCIVNESSTFYLKPGHFVFGPGLFGKSRCSFHLGDWNSVLMKDGLFFFLRWDAVDLSYVCSFRFLVLKLCVWVFLVVFFLLCFVPISIFYTYPLVYIIPRMLDQGLCPFGVDHTKAVGPRTMSLWCRSYQGCWTQDHVPLV